MNNKIKNITTVAIASTLLITQAVGVVDAIENDKTNETVKSELTLEQKIEQAKKDVDLATKNKDVASNKLDKINSELNEISNDKDKANETLNNADLDVKNNQELYNYITDENAKNVAEENVTLLNEKVNSAKDELEKINDEVKVAQDNVDNIKIDLDNATDANKTAQSEKNKAETNLNKKVEILEDLTNKKQESDKVTSDKNAELGKAYGNQINAKNEFDTALGDFNNKTEIKDQAQVSYDEINDKYEEANKDKVNAELEFENAKTEKENSEIALNDAKNIYEIAKDPAKKEELQNQITQASKDLEQAKQEVNKGHSNVQQAQNDIVTAEIELTNANNNISLAKKDMIELKNRLGVLEGTLGTKQDALTKKEQATSEVKKDFDFKQECVNQTQKELDAANQAIEQNNQTILDAQNKIDSYTPEYFEQLQAQLEAAQAAINKGSLGFFEHMGDTLAKDYLTNANGWNNDFYMSKTEIGAENDATSLENMDIAIQMLKECNDLRVAEGLEPLSVKGYLMAISQVNANVSAETLDHSHKGEVGENLHWGAGEKGNPYEGWYTTEKKVYDYMQEHYGHTDDKKLSIKDKMDIANALGIPGNMVQTGHYKNIINADYKYTGGAFNSNSQKDGYEYNGTHQQSFEANEKGGISYTVEDYQQMFNNYYNEVKANLANAQKALDEANKGLADAKAELAKAEEALKKAEADAEKATTNKAAYEEALKKAEEIYNAAKAEEDAAREEVTVAKQDVSYAKDEIKFQEKKIDELNKVVADKETNLTNKNNALVDRQNELKEYENRWNTIAKDKEHKEALLAKVEKDAADAEKNYFVATDRFNNAQVAFGTASQNLTEKTGILEALSSSLADAKSWLDECIANLTSSTKNYEEKMEAFNKANEKVETVKKELDVLQAENKEINDAHRLALSAKIEAEKELKTKEEALKAAKEAHEKAVAEHKVAKENYETKKVVADEAKARLDAANEALANSTGNLETLKAEQAKAQEAYDKAYNELTEAKKELDKFSQENIDKILSKLVDSKKALINAQNDFDLITKRYDNAIIKQQDAQKEYDRAVKNYEIAVDKYLSLKSELDSQKPSKPSINCAGDKDKNCDGIITCDEEHGFGWEWDENKKACVFNGSYYVVETSTK